MGLTRGSTRAHIARAVLDSIAFQVTDLVRAMNDDAPCPLTTLRVDGGAAVSDILMQTQADISDVPVHRPHCVETTATGAAYLAGLAVGYWKNKEEVRKNQAIDRVFYPEITEEDRAKRIKGWNKAVKYAYGWAKEEL